MGSDCLWEGRGDLGVGVGRGLFCRLFPFLLPLNHWHVSRAHRLTCDIFLLYFCAFHPCIAAHKAIVEKCCRSPGRSTCKVIPLPGAYSSRWIRLRILSGSQAAQTYTAENHSGRLTKLGGQNPEDLWATSALDPETWESLIYSNSWYLSCNWWEQAMGQTKGSWLHDFRFSHTMEYHAAIKNKSRMLHFPYSMFG